MKQWKNKITQFFRGRYGLDDLGKSIFLVSIVLYVLGAAMKNGGLALLGMIGLLIFCVRVLSGDRWTRREENCRYLAYVKLWKLKYENRKTAKVYMCSRCGRYIRVPKGKGKVQITCPGCGNRTVRKT